MPNASLVLITGATGGIGAATARRFARAGKGLLLWGRDQSKLDSIREQTLNHGAVKVQTVCCDLTQPDSLKKALEDLEEDASIETLILCAGTAEGSERLPKIEPADVRAMIEVNLASVVEITRALLPSMIERKAGHIVIVGSVAGVDASPMNSVYGATKAALRAFHESLRMELLGKQVRATLIEPGTIANEFGIKRMKGNEARARAIYSGFQALTSDDVAEAIEWCTDRPPHVNIHEMILTSVDQVGATSIHRSRDAILK